MSVGAPLQTAWLQLMVAYIAVAFCSAKTRQKEDNATIPLLSSFGFVDDNLIITFWVKSKSIKIFCGLFLRNYYLIFLNSLIGQAP